MYPLRKGLPIRRSEDGAGEDAPNDSEGDFDLPETMTVEGTHYINTIILHGRIQIFFYHRAQPMYFINKKHIIALMISMLRTCHCILPPTSNWNVENG